MAKHQRKHRQNSGCSAPSPSNNADYFAQPVNQAQLQQMTRTRLVSEGREAIRQGFAALEIAREKIELLQ